MTHAHSPATLTIYKKNGFFVFNSFSLKIFSAMLGFQMVSVKRVNFVLFVRSLTAVIAAIVGLRFFHVTSDWFPLKRK